PSAPSSPTITPRSSATPSATAGGTSPLSYQWYSGSVPISGATTSSITVAPSSTTSYFVRVTNACGTVDSATATVTVSPCTYTISPTSFAFDDRGGDGSVSITTASTCYWSSSSGGAWISLTGGTNGNGNGATTFIVAANTTPSNRISYVIAAGNTVVKNGRAAWRQTSITT